MSNLFFLLQRSCLSWIPSIWSNNHFYRIILKMFERGDLIVFIVIFWKCSKEEILTFAQWWMGAFPDFCTKNYDGSFSTPVLAWFGPCTLFYFSNSSSPSSNEDFIQLNNKNRRRIYREFRKTIFLHASSNAV